MSRRARIGAAVCLAVAGAAVAGWVALGPDAEPQAAPAPSGRVEQVQRGDLVDELTADGTLGYAGSRVTSSPLTGTITWLPDAGDEVHNRERLFEVDGAPVILLDGRVPMWRALGPETPDGADVRELQLALGVEASGSWDADTTDAVERLQERHDLPVTGRLEVGRVVFLPAPRRVAKVSAQLGAPAAAGPVLTTTSTRPSVTVALDAADQDVAREGMRVDVLLPDGRNLRGRVTDVGRVAETVPGDEGAGGGQTTIDVRVALRRRDTRRLRLDEAPVSVEMASDRRRDVLSVPATALIGVTGGGFAVQTPGGGQVRVRPGLFADGRVEVSGRGVREGLRVVVPQ